MRTAVHVDGAVGVRAADVEDIDALQLGEVYELHAIRRQELTRDARRLATGVWLELVLLPVVVDRTGPRLERHLSGPQRIGSRMPKTGSHRPLLPWDFHRPVLRAHWHRAVQAAVELCLTARCPDAADDALTTFAATAAGAAAPGHLREDR